MKRHRASEPEQESNSPSETEWTKLPRLMQMMLVAQKWVYIGPHGVIWYKFTGGKMVHEVMPGQFFQMTDEEPGIPRSIFGHTCDPWIGWHSESDDASQEGQGYTGLWYTYGSRAHQATTSQASSSSGD